MDDIPSTGGMLDIRNYAVGRLLLDNIPHIKAYWIMVGQPIAQISQRFGVDDLDGTVVQEKIYHMAGAKTPARTHRERHPPPHQRGGARAHRARHALPGSHAPRRSMGSSRLSITMKLGTVPFLNARPLTIALEGNPGVELVVEPPSKLAQMLESGELDGALVSSFALFQMQGARFRFLGWASQATARWRASGSIAGNRRTPCDAWGWIAGRSPRRTWRAVYLKTPLGGGARVRAHRPAQTTA